MLPKNYKINENIILNGSQEQKKEYLKKLELENNSHKEKSALYIEKMVSIAYKTFLNSGSQNHCEESVIAILKQAESSGLTRVRITKDN